MEVREKRRWQPEVNCIGKPARAWKEADMHCAWYPSTRVCVVFGACQDSKLIGPERAVRCSRRCPQATRVSISTPIPITLGHSLTPLNPNRRPHRQCGRSHRPTPPTGPALAPIPSSPPLALKKHIHLCEVQPGPFPHRLNSGWQTTLSLEFLKGFRCLSCFLLHSPAFVQVSLHSNERSLP